LPLPRVTNVTKEREKSMGERFSGALSLLKEAAKRNVPIKPKISNQKIRLISYLLTAWHRRP
jgi:hypothetical protein